MQPQWDYFLLKMVPSLPTSGLQPRREIFSARATQVIVKVFVTEPSDAINDEMAKQTEGRRLALSRKSSPSDSSLVDWFVGRLAL